MNRFLAALACFLLATPAQAAVAYVQSAGNGLSFTSGSTLNVSGITTTSNNAIVVFVSHPDSTTVSTVTDSAGNTYTPVKVTLDNTNAAVVNRVSIYGCVTCTSATSWTVTLNASVTFFYAHVSEYSGVQAFGNTATAPAPANFGDLVTTASVSVTTQDNDNMVVAGIAFNQGSASSLSWSSGTGRIGCDAQSTPACYTTAMNTHTYYTLSSDVAQVSPGSASVAFTWTGSSEITMVALELRTSSGGGGGGGTPVLSPLSGYRARRRLGIAYGGAFGVNGQQLSSFCGSTPATLSTTPFTITGGVVDGNSTARDFDVSTPASTGNSTPLNLVIVYHEAGGTSAGVETWGLQNATGAQGGSIFLYPQGITYLTFGVGWDDNCGGRDMPLFDNLVAWAGTHYCIDLNRVFVAGWSWGGDHTLALACCRGNKIRASAVGSVTDEFSSTSTWTNYNNYPCPVSTNAAIRFTHDGTLPYPDSGDVNYPAPYFYLTNQVCQYMGGCGSTTSTTADPNCVQYNGCGTYKPFRDCAYSGLGHARPADWAQATWDFFAAMGIGF